MNKLCNRLNINMHPLRDDYDISSLDVRHKTFSLDYLNPNLIELLASCGIEITHLEIFKRPRRHKSAIHTDRYDGEELVKINWIFGGENSCMHWFQLKVPNSGTPSTTIANTPYIDYEPEDVTLIKSVSTRQGLPYLVQTGIPHQVANPLEDRYCVSCVLNERFGNPLNMDTALLKLNNYLVTGAG